MTKFLSRFLLVVPFAAAAAAAQTPLEFAIVEELIEGDPFVSVMRIDLSPGSPVPGSTTLELSARTGLSMSLTSLSVYTDTLTSGGLALQGQSLFDLGVESSGFDRVISVILDNTRRFSSTRVTHVRLDLVSPDDMSWITLGFPLTTADSLASGLLGRDEFWSRAEVMSLEIGTACFPPAFAPPVDYSAPLRDGGPMEIVEPPADRSMAWKSLILPGWGQLSSGRGVGIVNILVEAAGIGLYASGHEEAGIAVVGANHLVSFTDLL